MADEQSPYSVTETTTALGVQHEFHGPGMPRHANGVHFMQPMSEWAAEQFKDPGFARADGKLVCRLLSAAYEAGRQSLMADVRRLIGARGTER